MKHGFIKIAMCTPQLKVGAPDYNLTNIKSAVKTAVKQNAEIAVFGNLSLTGATMGSMVKYSEVLDGAINALKDLVAFSKKIPLMLIVGLPLKIGNSFIDAAAVINKGKLECLIPDSFEHLGVIDLMDDSFSLDPYATVQVSNMDFNFGVSFLEDFDQLTPKSQNLILGGADLIFNLASSYALIDSFEHRQARIKSLSKRLSCGYIYVSTGNGESVNSFVYSGDKIAAELGEIITAAEGDKQDIVYAEIDIGAIKAENLYKNSDAVLHNNPAVQIDIQNNDTEVTRKINRLPFVPAKAEFDRIYDILGRGI